MANKTFVVQYLIKAREQFSEAAERTRKATKSMREEFERAKLSVEKTGKAFRNLGAKMSLALSTPIALLGLSFKNAARDAEETRSKYATVFRDISGAAESSADMLAKNYGLAGTKARELLGNTGDLLTGFGFTQESALKLSTEVNQLAVDLASFTNFSGGAEGASAALTKALLGERESIKSLGISILETDVKKKVSQLLAEGYTFATERQAKAQATLMLAMEQSKNAIGDFARTQHQLANQERILGSRIQDLKESFGRLLLPIALKVTQAMIRMMEALDNLSPAVKKAILIVGGLVAVVGPILLALGSLILMWPALAAGAVMFGSIASVALAGVGAMLSPLGVAILAIILLWDELAAFFKGFASGIDEAMGGTLSRLVGNFMEAARVITSLFGDGSETNKSLSEFTEVGRMMGAIVGDVIRLLINGLSGIGALLGQVVAAAVSMDFSQFDMQAIKAEFLGTKPEAAVSESNINFTATLGLDKGLKQTGGATVAGSGVRRADVGMN